MIRKKLMTKKLLVGSVLGAILSAAIISSCAVDTGLEAGRDSDRATVSQDISEREGDHSGSEHSGSREGNESSGEGSGEHDSGGDGSSTGSDGGGEINEAAMSSPITPLGQSWNGVLGGLAVSMQYDAATQAVHRNGTKHALTATLLRTGRTSPEVRNEDSRRAWPPRSWDI